VSMPLGSASVRGSDGTGTGDTTKPGGSARAAIAHGARVVFPPSPDADQEPPNQWLNQ
jgi:hypothetical protein